MNGSAGRSHDSDNITDIVCPDYIHTTHINATQNNLANSCEVNLNPSVVPTIQYGICNVLLCGIMWHQVKNNNIFS